MKRPILSVLIGVFTFTYVCQAQIIVTRSHLESLFGAGQTQLTYFDTTGGLVNIGLTGGPNVYDFSALSLPTPDSTISVSVTQVPELASRYPSDAVGWKVPEDTLGDEFEYIIFRFLDTAFLSPGEANISSAFERYKHNVPEETILQFPASFGDSSSFTITTSETTYVGGSPTMADSFTFSSNRSIDGWGTLILPSGDSVACLRMLEEYPGSEFKNFVYMGQDAVLFVETDTTEPNTGNVMAGEIEVVLGGLLLTSVEQVRTLSEIPKVFSLAQNYPNPFNPSTTIRFSLPKSRFVTLKIYNLLGQEIETLVSGFRIAGAYDIQWSPEQLSSGVYVYRLEAGEFIDTRRLVLLR